MAGNKNASVLPLPVSDLSRLGREGCQSFYKSPVIVNCARICVDARVAAAEERRRGQALDPGRGGDAELRLEAFDLSSRGNANKRRAGVGH